MSRPSLPPPELRAYLEELVRRTSAVCGDRLASVLAVGSLALGDYRHGRSDVDVTVVVDPALPRADLIPLAETLAHPVLPCPAAGLELVVYTADFAARPSGEAGYLLDLNTGPALPERAGYDPADASDFWYVIDRSIAHQAGLPLYGAPARDVIAAPDRPTVLAALSASVREHADGDGHLADNRVLNGCRATVHCRTGHWFPKRRAGEIVAASEPAFGPLIAEALRSFERPRAKAAVLPADDVREFLAWVAARVEEAAEAAGVRARAPRDG
ncbi:aminoglycoside adenylyltransferase domain-containing protein [Streptomyces cellulosae]